MLGIDRLVPEIMLGVGLAVLSGSLLAWVRAGKGNSKPFAMKNPSSRPRQQEFELSGITTSAEATRPPQSQPINRSRTLFFMFAGFVTAVWSLATILGRTT
ncbi:MAG: hypothetical protein C4317_04620 [Acidimicrobiia bacterium]